MKLNIHINDKVAQTAEDVAFMLDYISRNVAGRCGYITASDSGRVNRGEVKNAQGTLIGTWTLERW